MPRKCCRCGNSPSPESPRIVGSHPLKRTRRNRNDIIASQITNQYYEDYFKLKEEEKRIKEALEILSRRVMQPGSSHDSLTYIPNDVLDTIAAYAKRGGGPKTKKQKKQKQNRKNRNKTQTKHKQNTNKTQTKQKQNTNKTQKNTNKTQTKQKQNTKKHKKRIN